MPDKINVFIKMRLFESVSGTSFDAPRLLFAQRQAEVDYRRQQNLDDGDTIPYNTRKNFPFNRQIWANRGFVGCHNVIGDLNLY